MGTGAQFYRATLGISIENWKSTRTEAGAIILHPQANQPLRAASEKSFLILKPWVVLLKCVLHPNMNLRSQSLQMFTVCALWHAAVSALGM